VVYGAAVEKGLAFSNDPRRRVSLSYNPDMIMANIVVDVVAHYNSFSPPAISSSSRLARCSSASPPALSHSLCAKWLQKNPSVCVHRLGDRDDD
jgi:hypothetical protein